MTVRKLFFLFCSCLFLRNAQAVRYERPSGIMTGSVSRIASDEDPDLQDLQIASVPIILDIASRLQQEEPGVLEYIQDNPRPAADVVVTNYTNMDEENLLINVAIRRNRLDIVNLLLEQGESPHGSPTLIKHPLALALHEGHFEMADRLMDKIGTDAYTGFQCINWESSNPFSLLLGGLDKKYGPDGTPTRQRQVVALARRLYEANPTKMYGYLLDFNQRDGITVLHEAVRYGQKLLVDFILEKTLKPNEQLKLVSETDMGNTVLHTAALLGEDEILNVLVQRCGSEELSCKNCENHTYQDILEKCQEFIQYKRIQRANTVLECARRRDDPHSLAEIMEKIRNLEN